MPRARSGSVNLKALAARKSVGDESFEKAGIFY
jgi:hypothetical protein